ncbi:hypothetical protein [Endozoicomonas arenosclerae]|uniref:hypothetical protein n=1 Tax=Endozoicomonas arenosclerae TaxID=1633495 RepID=UPI001294647C|nr:hypothetical protein [Endozoicomonas arenosclerae]
MNCVYGFKSDRLLEGGLAFGGAGRVDHLKFWFDSGSNQQVESLWCVCHDAEDHCEVSSYQAFSCHGAFDCDAPHEGALDESIVFPDSVADTPVIHT